jgi:molybdate transport system ATP-binding protein
MRTLDVRLRVRHEGRGPDFSVDVAFQAPPGITILFGPSGAGKSTTLAAIAGLVTPDDGRIALGEDVWFDKAARVERAIHSRGVAYVFQSLALFPHMTAAANVEYGIDRTMPAPERRRRALGVLERMRVAHVANRRPGTFSGGEAQRVALARAFAMSPRLILLDEPFSAMDRQLRRELIADIRAQVAALGVPMIHVTHQRNEARALADRVILIDNGRIQMTGDAAELLPEM